MTNPSARKKSGRQPIRITEPSGCEVMRLIQEAYHLIGEPGSKALAEAAGVSKATAWRMLRGNPSPQLVAAQRMLVAMGFELRLVRAGKSRVPLRTTDA